MRTNRKFGALLEKLQERLERGDYAVGSLLPTEDQLAEEYGVSRFTLREALQSLERQGYIQRRRRAGTRVISNSSRTVFRHATGSYTDLHAFVQGTSLNLTRPQRIVADGKLARQLACNEMREWVTMEGVRTDIADGRPIGITKIYIDPEIATLPDEPDFGGKAVYEWLQENSGVVLSTVSQDISAVSLSAQEAEVFGERAGAPALRMVRRYFDNQQRIFEIAVTVHRSEDFVYNIRVHHS